MANSYAFLLMRGPILIIAVLVALFYPTLRQVSVETWIRLSILSFGVVLSVLDCFAVVKEWIRSSLRKHSQSIVLDDVLRWIFDKDGIIACTMSTVVGQATMYNFGNHEQRVRLVGSCLETSESDAEAILTTPGGVVRVLPESVQNWLNEPSTIDVDAESNTGAEPVVATSSTSKKQPPQVERECDASSNDSDDETETPAKEPLQTPRAVQRPRSSSSRGESQPRSHSGVEQRPITSPPIDATPEQVVVSIVKEIITERFKNVCYALPASYVKCIGIAASAALTMQLRFSPTARRVTMGLVQGATATSLAGVALGALGALVAKQNIGETEQMGNRPHDPRRASFTKLVEKARQALHLLMERAEFDHWRGTVALIILFFVGSFRKKLSMSN